MMINRKVGKVILNTSDQMQVRCRLLRGRAITSDSRSS